jgi:hypothetical protein
VRWIVAFVRRPTMSAQCQLLGSEADLLRKGLIRRS